MAEAGALADQIQGVAAQAMMIDCYWTIKKDLEQSDVDSSSRLLIGKMLVRDHMLPYIGDFDETRGKELTVYDMDTQTSHTLVLKTWATGSYVLTSGWMDGFVRRRGLRKSHTIGLRWEEADGRFEFSVLFNGAIDKELGELLDTLVMEYC